MVQTLGSGPHSAVLSQKGQSAADRLAKLPVLRSACTKLSVLYTDTKCSHPSLRAVCERLESGVTAALSPVILKLEPQSEYRAVMLCPKKCMWLDWNYYSFFFVFN